MDFEFNDDLKMLQKMVRDFVQKEIAPYADEWDENHVYPREIIKKMGELGLFGCTIPEEYGGNGMGFLAQMIITEELAYGSSGLRIAVNCNGLGSAFEIYKFGTEEAKQKYIPKLLSGELLGAFAITEPNSGSDVMSMKTTIEDKGDYLVLNGQKMWISNIPAADIAIVYGYYNRSKRGRGMAAVIMEMNSEGVTVGEIDKLGTRSFPAGEISMDNVKVPKENLLGNLGDGAKILFSSLNQTRLSAAAGGVGVAQACLDVATQYCNEREQFGQLIGKFQMNQDMIAEMSVEIECARLLVYKAAWQKDQGNINNTREVAFAKYMAGRTAQKASHYCMKILSAYGYSTEYPSARLYRDAVLYQIVEGTESVMKWIIAEDKLGYRKLNK